MTDFCRGPFERLAQPGFDVSHGTNCDDFWDRVLLEFRREVLWQF